MESITESITDSYVKEINPAYIQEIAEVHSIKRKVRNEKLRPLTNEKRKFIEENIRCGPSVLEEIRKQYRDLVLKHHAI